jgi:cyclic pyranopterin phosphate synthase
MPLTDGFGREITYLRISVTDRCNLKCSYCMPEHPPHAPREDLLRFEEIDRLVGVAVGLGWRKVRLTGGEPLVRKDMLELVRMLGRRKRPTNGAPPLEQLVMTTNGILLARHADALRAAGLDRVNVSLDTLDRDRFREITGYDRLPQVLEGIEAAVGAGLLPVKINTVLVKGATEDELPGFLDLARRRPVDIRFIEFMPFGGNGWSLSRVLQSGDLEEAIRGRETLVPAETPRDGGPARTFRAPGWEGRVSFISPISDRSFCTRCNRVRLTSEGRLRGCLLNENEIDFRDALRSGASDAELAALFRRAVVEKPEEHPFHARIEAGAPVVSVEGRGMYRIGG